MAKSGHHAGLHFDRIFSLLLIDHDNLMFPITSPQKRAE